MNEDDIRNDLLQEIVCHSSKCAHCVYLHKKAENEDEDFCFLAYACLTKDFYYFDDGD